MDKDKKKISGKIRSKLSAFIIDNIDDFIAGWKTLPNNCQNKYRIFIDVLKMVVPPPPAEPTEDEANTIISAIAKSINDSKAFEDEHSNK